ncbi:hypothetical protein ACRRVD_04165 [Candidatus Cardinium hertigii]|uniref:hypothetical protein n=1 Tax=Candidatus Cardinium hertigii TaxID=247481 RepID=UPI003D7EBEB9
MMFYNKNKLILFLFYHFLLLSSNCKQVPISSISEHKDIQQDYTLARKPPVLSLSSCKELGSISCMEGAKTDFLVQCKGTISNIDLPLKGQLAFIGIVDGAKPLNKASAIVKSAIDAKDKIETLLWQGEDGFIYWHKADTDINESIIKIKEEDYKKLISKKYAVHMLYLPNSASPKDYIISNNSVQIDIKGKDALLPNYQNIGLEAMYPIEEQINNATDWFLKGKIQNAYLKDDAKMGFILVREPINPYPLVQKVIASKDGWPTAPTSFNDEMIIIPGTLREIDPAIVGTLLSNHAPIQGGKFKIICYWIQNQHCYLSQMEHIISDGTSKSYSSAPPTILFTDDGHNLKVSNVSLCSEQVSEGRQAVTLSDFKIEYVVNNEVTPLPAHLKPSLLFLQKGTLWRTATIESLFKKLDASNQKAGISDDGTICLVTDSGKLLNQSCINFFSRAADYEYFVCLFSKENHKLTFCTQKEKITIEKKEKPQPPKKDIPESHGPIHITLDNKNAHITLGIYRWWPLLSSYVDYSLPKVTLVPSQLDKNNLADRGFLITKAKKLNASKMDDYSCVINKFIENKSKNGSVFYKNTFLIFQEKLNPEMKQELINNMYNAYEKESAGKQTLKISYWAKCENKIVWSNPVSIELIIN